MLAQLDSKLVRRVKLVNELEAGVIAPRLVMAQITPGFPTPAE
jgi:hypothetical protein